MAHDFCKLDRFFLLLPFALTLTLTQCELPTGAGAGASSAGLSAATKEAPFVNSLGMKFVPVPGTNILMCTTEASELQWMGGGGALGSDGVGGGAMGIAWDNAKAWCARLSQKEGKRYRLPTNAEWDAAAGASMATLYPWGATWPPPNNYANYMGQEAKTGGNREYAESYEVKSLNSIKGFQDQHASDARPGSYPANELGIHDLFGNLWEWVGDAPHMRGASWINSDKRELESAHHWVVTPDTLSPTSGLRVVVER